LSGFPFCDKLFRIIWLWEQLERRRRSRSVYFRTRSLLTSGDGTPALKRGSTGAYGEGVQGGPTYSGSIVERIFDAYRDRGVRPCDARPVH
jgi:hypothetical protein